MEISPEALQLYTNLKLFQYLEAVHDHEAIQHYHRNGSINIELRPNLTCLTQIIYKNLFIILFREDVILIKKWNNIKVFMQLQIIIIARSCLLHLKVIMALVS